MAKRTFWLVTGVALGAGSSLWAERRVRRTVQEAQARLQPDALVAEVGRSARKAAEVAGDRMRDAMAAGRSEMRQHERRLWDDLAERGVEPPDGQADELQRRGRTEAESAAEQARLAERIRPRRLRRTVLSSTIESGPATDPSITRPANGRPDPTTELEMISTGDHETTPGDPSGPPVAPSTRTRSRARRVRSASSASSNSSSRPSAQAPATSSAPKSPSDLGK